MNIPDQHVQALMRFGYTERESRFLYLVATFSGHFLRSHFEDFLDLTHGRPANDFIDKAIARKHIRAFPYLNLTRTCSRYHLFSRPIYAAIGKENSANRKPGRDAKANLKLRILSFVLDNLGETYLEEEQDKFNFFTVSKGLGPALLPAKVYKGARNPAESTTRYFVDKFLVFTSPSEDGPDVVPTFTYFEEDQESLTSFPTHLQWYKPLLKALESRYNFIYVADEPTNFLRAQRQFAAILADGNGQPYFPSMLTYFRLRQLWEAKKYERLADKDYVALNRGEKKFSTPAYETLYRKWLRGESIPANEPTVYKETHNEVCPKLQTFRVYL